MDVATQSLMSELSRFTAALNAERQALEEARKELAEVQRRAREQLDKERRDLEEERLAFEHEKNNLGAFVENDDILTLNVGGVELTCRRGTLLQAPDSYLGSLFSGRWEDQLQRDANGRIYLEFNGVCFQALLEHLRDRVIPCTTGIPQLRIPEGEEERMFRMLEFLQLTSPKQFEYTGKIEDFVVPTTCMYHVRVAGAAGGSGGKPGGRGAIVSGVVQLHQNEVVKMLVGQCGKKREGAKDAGGGGGTFFVRGNSMPLLVAGGGGGSRGNSGDPPGNDASVVAEGGCGGGSHNGTGGVEGGGGTRAGGNHFGGGGAGFFGNGEKDDGGDDPRAFVKGGAGGMNGGFGGGGGTGNSGGGGGGGYSGGGGGNSGGGGGSYTGEMVRGAMVTIGNTSNGYVIVTPGALQWAQPRDTSSKV